MTITLTLKEQDELHEEAERQSLQNVEKFETISQISRQLGKGCVREIEVYPNLWLSIDDWQYHDDVRCQVPVAEHPLHFNVLLSGKRKSDYGTFGEGYTLISGGGIQPQMTEETEKFQHILGVQILMPPSMLANFFFGEDGEILPQLKMLARDNDWQEILYLKTTPALQGIAQQIINCPFSGITKQVYLQGKVLEWMALQLAPLIADDKRLPPPRLKPKTISRLHHAREILLSRLENPPSVLELATMVGVSPRTLKRGFPELFGTTVFGYLTDKRMEYAEKLLRQGNITVTEVANQVGYSNPGHFAAAFKRRFCITPRQCLTGNKIA
ncbi:AraC family transcriptional regulator [Chlorogloeopsis sp. ULAP01]|uniref:helix-turn-helix transcriptional regulator n=1 Tax=Chlorogloeopsis sp. ULAP01 TaxID=3056483 RepID=UPI0025AA59C0|nr:AraC family transcriptional regulator [Chlorogloeopsis sp. ULAP01]MDM9379853.1 AraC family transcriptional regulator [Chlorogloeopsis sp. ULAP01]